jgi:hypothetical protein
VCRTAKLKKQVENNLHIKKRRTIMRRISLFSKSGRASRNLNAGTRQIAALCLIGLATMPAAAANLLTNPGFESGPGSLFPGGVAILSSTNVSAPYTSGYATGIWGAENAAVISSSTAAAVPPPTPQVINPNSGNYMLDMRGANTSSYSQAWQLVDVTPYQTPINGGGVTVDFSAYFNAPLFVDSTGLADQPLAEVTLQFYDSSYLTTYQQLDAPGVPISGSNAQTITPLIWTQIGLTGISVPAGTSYILAQVAFDNASLTDPVNSTDYDGYVDDANLTLDNVPEPTAAGLLGVLPLVLRRNRKQTPSLSE